MAKVNDHISKETANVNARTTEETGRLEVRISAVQSNLIRWMFISWIGQMGTLLGILFAFFK